MKILDTDFFNRSTPIVAMDLIGKFLIRRHRGKTEAHMITEVEAYDGFCDKASHASRGQTKRNAPMFGSPGQWYVYFTYGMHWMLNVVTREKGYPAAILIRGIRPVRSRPAEGTAKTALGRSASNGISGPARLTQKLHIDGKLNGLKANKKTGLWIEKGGVKVSPRRIKKSARVGVDYAGPYWARRRWRFRLVP